MSHQKNKIKLFIDRALSRSIGQQALILLGLLALLLLFSALLLLCSRGAWSGFCAKNHVSPWLLPIYLLIDTNALNTIYTNGGSGWMLFACTLTYIFGLLVCSGMLIGVITNYIEDRVQRHRDGLLHYVKSGHYIIMGYDDMVQSIIADIYKKHENDNPDILILTAVDAKTIRERLNKSVARAKMDHIFITYGQRTSMEYYGDIRLEHSKEIFIVGKRDHPAHDAVNVECAENVFSYLKEHKTADGPKTITCVFEDLDTYAAFKTTEIFTSLTKGLKIEFLPYNFYTGWARQLFVTRKYREKIKSEELDYPSVYDNGIAPGTKKYVHLVFVGTSNFSVAFAMEAAHLMHFPNYEQDDSLKTRITFIDLNADEELKLFSTRNRHFFEVQPYYYYDTTTEELSLKKNLSENNSYTFTYTPQTDAQQKTKLLSKDLEKTGFLDVEFEFIKGDVFSSEVQKIIKEWATDEKQLLSLFFAMSDQRKNFIIGMNMPDEVYDKGIPVFIRQNRADDFVTSLRMADAKDDNGKEKKINYYSVDEKDCLQIKERKGRYAHIYPFGMEDMAYFSDTKTLRQAKLINYLYWESKNNRFPDRIVLDAILPNSIREKADDYWREISVAEKWSNLYAAYSIKHKLDSLRVMRGLKPDDHSKDLDSLSYDEQEHLAAVEHNRWNVEKLLMGYRKARPNEDKYCHPAFSDEFNKNNKKKLYIHHDIRPFNDLDGIQQMDFEIVKYIPWILEMTED